MKFSREKIQLLIILVTALIFGFLLGLLFCWHCGGSIIKANTPSINPPISSPIPETPTIDPINATQGATPYATPPSTYPSLQLPSTLASPPASPLASPNTTSPPSPSDPCD